MDESPDMEVVYEIFKKDRFAVENGMYITKVEPGHAQARMDISGRHKNGYGAVQGGAIFTLADYAFAAASNAKGFATVSCSSQISFFRPPEGTYIVAKADEVYSGRRLCTYNVDITDENGNLVARLTGNGYIKKTKIDLHN